MTNSTNLVEIFMAHEARKRIQSTQPYAPHTLMVICTALSMVIMAYSTHFKVWPILIFFALWLPLPLIRGGSAIFKPVPALLFTLSLPLLCTISTLWSMHPAVTLYLGSAFIVLNLCVWMSARVASIDAWIEGICVGASLTLLLTLINGTYAINPATHTPELMGLFSSKNQVGFVAEVGIIATLALLGISGMRARRCAIAMFTLGICTICLYLSHSSTALLSLVAVIMGVALVYLLRWLPVSLRGVALLGVSALLVCLTMLLFGDGSNVLLSAMGKNATFTGRTYLWREGWKLAQEHPLLGRGYSAFWVQGEPLAERYWQEFFITARGGFHFHQTFLQAMVDVGIIGTAIIVSIMGWVLFASVRRCLSTSALHEDYFLLALALMFSLRAWFEIDIFTGPFSIGAFLFYAILPRLGRAGASPLGRGNEA